MKDYKKFFDNKKIKMLFEQYDEKHVIDLINNEKLLFIFLYNLT